MEIRDWGSGGRGWLPWAVAGTLSLLLLALMALGWWQGGATGPQVQVPMFYDAHYLFPRPWTQSQSVPGVPGPAPVALYADNTISQSFTAVSANVGLVSLWLDGPSGTVVSAALIMPDGGVYAADFALDERPRPYAFRFPPTTTAGEMTLRLQALEATPRAPVIVHTVGGDRLGAAVRLNEFIRPGNLALHTYARGFPGLWWLDTVSAQILPEIFRLRLQQYKPLKGPIFPLLLLTTGVLTLLFLLLARPGKQPLLSAAGWLTVILLGGFLAWQVGSGRLRLAPPTITLQPVAPVAPVAPLAAVGAAGPRLVDDFILTLWTAQRDPEPRFVAYGQVADYPAVRVPADSQLAFARTLLPNGRLRAGFLVQGGGILHYQVLWRDLVLAEGTAADSGGTVWLDVDLAPLAGQVGTLHLVTAAETGAPDGVWLMPQLLAETDWLLAQLPETAVAADAVFGERVALAGYAVQPDGDQLRVTLYWQALAPLDTYATVFVHALDESGEILAQSDAQPVQNSYPLPLWSPGIMVADTHVLPAVEAVALGVGLYDAETLTNWSAVADKEAVANGRVLLPLPESGP